MEFVIKELLFVQGVSKDTDTFQSLIIKKLDNLRKFFHITKVSMTLVMWNCKTKKQSKTVKQSFNGLTGVASTQYFQFILLKMQ